MSTPRHGCPETKAPEMAAPGYRVAHIVGRGKPGYEEPLPPDTQPP